MFHGYRVSVWDVEKFLELDGGDDFITTLIIQMRKMNLRREVTIPKSHTKYLTSSG